jgi:hypothetical protein
VAVERIVVNFALLMVPLLHRNHFSPPPEMCDNPEQAAQYHILEHEVGSFIHDPTRIWLPAERAKFQWDNAHKNWCFTPVNTALSL